ncbi:hypothetical protein N7468_002134 [Penicillium chermesinum]|uniref:Uncharacterized protein n=1 Tax=Penicillium chermesinum TaxID=63820 RepID=A0A9W9PJK9_9EURO|nr:uncharacterized protein N7468_002134 [Penicillium chermesinum]KAJ5247151.1 hypothetical protein N7468_002134 [Penicillium chermesinum]
MDSYQLPAQRPRAPPRNAELKFFGILQLSFPNFLPPSKTFETCSHISIPSRLSRIRPSSRNTRHVSIAGAFIFPSEIDGDVPGRH